jgi:TetR/AcrR family transcriptional regulator, cholesterol catabolism regulator
VARSSRKHNLQKAARSVFGTDGYERATMQKMAAMTGILKGSIYAHFASKEDLYFSLLTDDLLAMTAKLRAIAESESTAVEKLKRAIRTHIVRDPELLPMSEDWRALGAEHLAAFRRMRREYAQLWEGIIQEGIDNHEFSISDAWLGRVVTVSVADHALTWIRADGPRPLDQLAESFANALLEGLLPRTDQPESSRAIDS